MYKIPRSDITAGAPSAEGGSRTRYKKIRQWRIILRPREEFYTSFFLDHQPNPTTNSNLWQAMMLEQT